MYYKLRKYNENWSHFLFFSCELPLILGLGETKKKARDIYKRTLDIEFERDQSIGLLSIIGDGWTDRYTHTFFSKTHF